MNGMPPFHPEALVTFWLSTPGLNLLNPHWTLGTLVFIGIILLYYRKTKQTQTDHTEELFQALLQTKRIVEKKIQELDWTAPEGVEDEGQVSDKRVQYQKQLDEVNQKLRHYT